MLDDPEAKHDLAVHIPDGHLLTGHVIDLAALLSKKRGAAWSTRFSGRTVNNQAAALYSLALQEDASNPTRL